MSYFLIYFLIGFLICTGYIVLRYLQSDNKAHFFKSQLTKPILWTATMIFVSVVLVNYFVPNPKFVYDESYEIPVDSIISKEKKLEQLIEADYLNVDLHQQYIANHFTLPMRWMEDGDYVNRNDVGIENYYYDKTQYSEQDYSDLAFFGLGVVYSNLNKNVEALESFSKVRNRALKYLNYYRAEVYLKRKDFRNAEKFYEAEAKMKGGFTRKAYQSLVSVLEKENKEAKLMELLYNPVARNSFAPDLALKLYFKDFNIPAYYYVFISSTFKNITATAILAAGLILLTWLFYIIKVDFFERERMLPVFCTLILGMIFSFATSLLTHFNEFILGYTLTGNKLNDFFYTIFGIGVVEEFVKILPFLLMLAFTRYINEPLDYILYASVSALGFAFVENMIYFEGNPTIIHGRALTAVVAHMFNSSLIAYGLVLSKYRYNNRSPLLFFAAFFLLGSLAHGVYDFLIMTHFIPAFILFFFFSITNWMVMINNSLNNSSYFSYKKNFDSEKLQFQMALALTSILVFEYAAVAFDNGPIIANHSLVGSLLTGSFLIVFFTSKLARFDLIKDYWSSVTYKGHGSFNLYRFIGWMIVGDIRPHNFVGREVELYPAGENKINFPGILKGKIADRKVVLSEAEGADPYWFLINLYDLSNINGQRQYGFLIKIPEEYTSLQANEKIEVDLYGISEMEMLHKEKILKNELSNLGKIIISAIK